MVNYNTRAKYWLSIIKKNNMLRCLEVHNNCPKCNEPGKLIPGYYQFMLNGEVKFILNGHICYRVGRESSSHFLRHDMICYDCEHTWSSISEDHEIKKRVKQCEKPKDESRRL